MIRVAVNIDLSKAVAKLDLFKTNQVPFATALALTRTAQGVATDLVDEMRHVFQAPTPFTLSALYIKPAKKTELTAYVWVKDKQRHWLLTEIEGGARNVKGFENLLIRAGVMPKGWYAVPASGATLNQYGNIASGYSNQILSQLQAARDSLTNESLAKKQLRNRRKSQVRRFFAVQVGQASGLRPGIYMRESNTNRGGIVPVFLFVPTAPKYRKRFDFYGVGNRMAQQRFAAEFDKAIAIATETAR